jgi:Glycosyl hydrolases family 39
MSIESPYGINAHLPSAQEMDGLVGLGASWVRLDFNWPDLEPTRDGYDYSLTDSIVAPLVQRGISIYATLAYTPGWANGGQGRNTPPTDSRDWWNFCHNVARHYAGQITHYGMWNEPNQKGFFSGSMAQYINLILEPGFQAIKAATPQALVCGPELAMMDNWQAWLSTILARGGRFLDVVTQHCYEHDGHAVIRAMRQVPTGPKPLWLTETGWNTNRVSEADQANYYGQLLESLPGANFGKVFAFDLNSSGIGIMGKPAYHVYRGMIQSTTPSV